VKTLRLSVVLAPALFAIVACGTGGKPGPDGKAGAPGTAGAPPPVAEQTSAINLIEPHVGLLARRVEVTIGTDGKLDLAKATADFGDGVKVTKIEPRGNALVATLEISPEAKLGKHDVTIEADGKTLIAKSGFVVAVHLDAKVGAGKAEQGGLVRLDISNRDAIWFDTEKFALFPLAKQSDPSLIGLAYQSFTATDGSVVFLGDPLAKTGPLGFLGFNDPSDETSASYLTEANAVTVTARQPIDLTTGTGAVDRTLENDLETGFFSVDLTPGEKEGLLVEAWARVPTGSTMAPLLLAYPKSGSAADLLDQGRNDPGYPMFGIPATEARVAYPVTQATKAFFVVADANLGHGPSTKFTLAHSAVRAQIFNEKTDAHATAETAQNLGSLPNITTAVPGRILNGELKAADEVDYYKLTGLSAVNATDMLVSVISDSDVIVRIDTVPTFDSDHLVEVVRGGKAGMGVTTDFVGQSRFIQVLPKPESLTSVGKYTLGIKRLAPAVIQQ
jgi:hypothetical protein